MPLAELQSIWISKYLLGQYALPAPQDLQQIIQREREALRKRFGNSPRHTMEVDYLPYVRSVQKEMRRGTKRQAPATPLIQRESQRAEEAHSLSAEH